MAVDNQCEEDVARIKNAVKTTNAVLESLTYSKSDDLTKRQAKLTATASQLEQLLEGPLSALLNEEEKKAIQEASIIVSDLSGRVMHAKEIRKREERRKATFVLQRGKLIDEVVEKTFMAASGVEDAKEQISKAVIMILFLHEQSAYLDFYSTEEVREDTLHLITQRLRRFSLREVANHLQWQIKSAMRDSIERRLDLDPQAAVTSWISGSETNKERIAKQHEDLIAQIHHLVSNHADEVSS